MFDTVSTTALNAGTVTIAALEAAKKEAVAHTTSVFDRLINSASVPVSKPKIPTLEQCQEPANKNGKNLTPRGEEICYRLFDDGAGYNRVGKSLNISQMAAKNRKGLWTRAGGLNRTRMVLDFD